MDAWPPSPAEVLKAVSHEEMTLMPLFLFLNSHHMKRFGSLGPASVRRASDAGSAPDFYIFFYY